MPGRPDSHIESQHPGGGGGLQAQRYSTGRLLRTGGKKPGPLLQRLAQGERGRRALLACKQALHPAFNGCPSQVHRLDNSIAVDEEAGGDAVDVKQNRELVLPLAAIVEMEPVHFLPGDLLLEPLLVVIEAHCENLEALVLVFRVGLLQLGKLGHTGAAPGGPEIDQHHLACEARRGNGFTAAMVLHLEVLQLAADDAELLENRFQPRQHPALAGCGHRPLHLVHKASRLIDFSCAGKRRGQLAGIALRLVRIFLLDCLQLRQRLFGLSGEQVGGPFTNPGDSREVALWPGCKEIAVDRGGLGVAVHSPEADRLQVERFFPQGRVLETLQENVDLREPFIGTLTEDQVALAADTEKLIDLTHRQLVGGQLFGLRRRLSRQQLLYPAAELISTQLAVANPAFPIEKEGEGNAANIVQHAGPGLPALAIIELGPAHAVLLDEGAKLVLVAFAIEAYTENGKPLVFVFLPGGHHVGHLANAGAAPGGPEIDQEDLAAEVLDRDLLAIDGRA